MQASNMLHSKLLLILCLAGFLVSRNLFAGRYYNAAIGRFLQVDPLADNLPSQSSYSYSLNNPIVFFDPTGEFPFTFHVRSFHPAKTFGGGFDGDNRSFSTSDAATSRIKQNFTLETDNGSISGGIPTSDPSYHSVFGADTETPSGMALNVGDFQSNDDNTFLLYSEYSGNNPLVPSPDIDVNVSIAVTENRKDGTLTLTFKGAGDGFPNTEFFIEDSKGNRMMLGTSSFNGTPLKLFGKADTQIFSGTVIIRIDENGNFILEENNDGQTTD